LSASASERGFRRTHFFFLCAAGAEVDGVDRDGSYGAILLGGILIQRRRFKHYEKIFGL
jgi:hypothetical protein